MQSDTTTSGTAMSGDEILAYHEKHFNSTAFLDAFVLSKSTSEDHAGFVKGFARMYHEVFSAHPPSERLLDVGSGPTLWHVMSASAKYKSITLSDPLPQNRHMQQMYMNDVGQDNRWTEHFKLTARLEGDEEKWREVATRLRSCIKEVIRCNVRDKHPLGEERADDLYDCVMTSLCLDVACLDVPAFITAVKHYVSLAKPGAPIVIGEVLDTPGYGFGDSSYKSLSLTKCIIVDALEAAGCTVTKFLSSANMDDVGANKGLVVIEARKP